MNYLRCLAALTTTLLLQSTISADMIVSDTLPTAANAFSDGGNDWWGVVDAGGTTINGGSAFSSNFAVVPPAGSIAGRDMDDGGLKAVPQTATWELALPAGHTHFTNIEFDATAAASQTGVGGAASTWNNANHHSLTFRLTVGPSVSTLIYSRDAGSSNLALNGTGAVLPVGGSNVNLTDAGGVGVTSATLELIAAADQGQEIFWVTGTLTGTAVAVAVPEPSSFLFLGLISVYGAFARWKRNG